MKVSLNWLTDYVDLAMPVAELSALLMRLGLPVEGIEETDADIALDLEVTSNRPDCLGHIGVARELAAALGQPLKVPDLTKIVAAGGPVGDATSVSVEAPDFCPRYTARLIKGVKVGPSPAWLAERLEAVGLRAINNIVDATNYVLMEYSQPLHAFDYDKLAGGRIVVRRAVDGETITAIDESKHELHGWMGIIADAEKPVAVAGVMGGLDSEVSEQTVNVLIESAQFDPLSIRRASRALNLLSDASYRFERSVDPVALDDASLRACRLILDTAGGELLDGIVDVWADAYEAPSVALRPERTSKLLGIDVPPGRQVEILDSLGLQPKQTDGRIACIIPPHRPDLTREVDLIEEVARVHGFDKIPTGGAVTHEVTTLAPVENARRAAGETLNAAGYFEAITFTFIDEAESALFGWTDSLAVDTRLRKTNGTLRQGLLPSLLRARKANQDAGNEQVSLFELSAAFPPRVAGKDGQALPDEYTQLALLTDGSLQELRGALEAVVRRADPSARLDVRPTEVAGFAKGAAAELALVIGAGEQERAEPFGVLGQVGQAACDHYNLTVTPCGAMVRFDPLIELGQTARSYRPVPRMPAIRRDLSAIVDEPVTWEVITGVVGASGGELMTGVEYVGAYRGKQIGKGRKSLTLRLTYRHAERTLRHEEVDASVEAVVAALKQQVGAELRTD